jgi:sugar/nucleoside kinase (ribokinase family)
MIGMSVSRERVCEASARKLAEAGPSLSSRRAVVGLDGFVDEIIAVVDKRYSDESYDTVRSIGALAEKIGNAAGESSNYELVVKQRKLGGNGPIMANALACLGLDVTYIGNLGYPSLHTVFEEFATRAHVISIAEPGHTDALEFDDGKLMLGKHGTLNDVNWDNLVSRVGRDELSRLFEGANLIGLVNWTMLPQMSRIWSKLLDEVFTAGKRRAGTLFIDLADPEKRTPEDILGALSVLSRFQKRLNVILGLNLKEAMEIAAVLGMPERDDPEAAIEAMAAAIRQELDLACVVIHPRRAAAAATATESAWFAGPFVQHPMISTGAGDHFNAGFCTGRILGLGLAESLCTGVSTSGYYVRTARSPSVAQLAEFVAALPPPQA